MKVISWTWINIMIYRTYKDKQVMILDEVKTQTQSPTLTELKSLLKLILEWCQTYKQMLLQIEA